MGAKLVYESLSELLEKKSSTIKVIDKKADIKDKIKALELQLKDAKKLGGNKDNLKARKQKVEDIKDKIEKFKAKLNESEDSQKLIKLKARLKEMNSMKVPHDKDSQQDFFDEKGQLESDIKKASKVNEYGYMYPAEEGIDSEGYWEEVADAMGGTLEEFTISEEGRLIVIQDVNRAARTSGMVEIRHDWRHDGSETKPWTYINGDDRYGRLAIWEDDPQAYAEDILAGV